MQDLLIKGGRVLLFEDNDVVIEEKDILIKDGKIVQIKEKIEEDNIKVIEAVNNIVMPGLINTHAHIPIFRETTEGCKLYEWLNEKIWPREEKLTKEDVYWASMLSYYEMISTGTTTINDQYFMSEEIRKAAEDCKIRAVITRTIMDTDGSFEQRIQEFKDFYESRDKTNN